MNKKKSIKKLVENINIGAITSNQVIRKILSKIDFNDANTIVKYGVGNGLITKALLSKMKEDAVLIVFETNNNLISNLSKIDDNRLIIINADAEKAKNILKDKFNIELVDYIISTIPFTFIDRKKSRRIIYRSHALLNKKGKFITHHNSRLMFHLIKKLFSKSNIRPVLINIPPRVVVEGVK